MQARIAVLEPQAVAVSSWRLPQDLIPCLDKRMGPFLASNEQSTNLTGDFYGIAEARKWVKRYFGTTGASPLGISATAFGTGQNAGVKLSKNEASREIVAKLCAEYADEIRQLRKLLLVRGGDDAVGDSNVGSGVGSGVNSSGSRKKKAKVSSA